MAHDSGQTPDGAPSADQPNNTAWVVGAVVAIAVLATVLTLIGIKAGDDETTPTANPPVVAPPVATAPTVSHAQQQRFRQAVDLGQAFRRGVHVAKPAVAGVAPATSAKPSSAAPATASSARPSAAASAPAASGSGSVSGSGSGTGSGSGSGSIDTGTAVKPVVPVVPPVKPSASTAPAGKPSPSASAHASMPGMPATMPGMTSAPTSKPSAAATSEPAEPSAVPSGAPTTGFGGTADSNNVPLALGGLAALLAAGAVAGSATRRRRSQS